jgi:steroid 5-alpha reductase family enzyme
MNAGPAFLLGMALIAFVFFLAWGWARRWDHYSIVDAVWAFGIGGIATLWLYQAGDGMAKHWVAAGLVLLWSFRLGLHLEKRIRKMRPAEDSRYAKLRDVWKGRVASSFLWFFQAQAVSVALLATPFLWIAQDPDGAWSVWESVGVLICLIGISGEGLADAQMSAFKRKNSDSKAVCQEGLWRYSRHPNYFFEAVIWVGFYTYACGSEMGWTTVYAPAVIVYLLLKVTGIPPTEAAAILRKGDAYRRYQATTSAFVPLPPKKTLF